MKKAICILLSFVLFVFLSVTAYAAEDTNGQAGETVTTVYTNEYDYIQMLQNCTQEELAEFGFSQVDVDEIVAAFFSAITERAVLSDDALYDLGYGKEEIDTLRAYSKGARVSNAEIRGLAAVLTARIRVNYCGTKSATFRYEWCWDHAPFMALQDSAAMRWIAFDSRGHELDVTKTVEEVKINYYLGTECKATLRGMQEPDLDFNSINVQFDENILCGGPNGPTTAYGRDGSIRITVEVEDSVKNNINYIKVAALYGHTLIGANAPSISLSPTGSISISFSGNVSIDKIGGHKVKIGVGSTIEDI